MKLQRNVWKWFCLMVIFALTACGSDTGSTDHSDTGNRTMVNANVTTPQDLHVCHTDPAVGEFVYSVSTNTNMGSGRVFATLQDADRFARNDMLGGGWTVVGTLDSVLLDLDFGYDLADHATHQILAGPECMGGQCYWEISGMTDQPSGWFPLPQSDVCIWEYPGGFALSPGNTVRVDRSIRNMETNQDDLSIKFRTDLDSQSGSIQSVANGTHLTIIGGPRQLKPTGFRWWQVELPNGQQGWVPEGLPHELWLVPTGDAVASSHDAFTGTDQPTTTPYAWIPAVVAPQRLLVYDQAGGAQAQVIGRPEIVRFYEIVATDGMWTQIRSADGQLGWVETWILQIGNRISIEINIDALLADPGTAMNVYSADELPERYDPAREYLIDELGLVTGNAISYAWFAVEVGSGSADISSIVCSPLDVISDYSELNTSEFEKVDLGCVAIDLTRGGYILLTGGTPVGVYITVVEVALENLGPFIRWNDRVWMDRTNRYFGSCPLTSIIFGQDNACR